MHSRLSRDLGNSPGLEVVRRLCLEDKRASPRDFVKALPLLLRQVSRVRDKDELRGGILTRVQGNNDRKSMLFKKKLPAFVSDVLAEFDAFWEEKK